MHLEPTQGGAIDDAGGRDAPQPSGRDAPPPVDPGAGDSLDGLRATLAKERADRARLEGEVKKLMAAQARVEDAKKSDVERLTSELAKASARATELEAAARARDVRDAVVGAAEKAQARRPASVYKLIADELAYDDEGRPTNLAILLDALKKSDPELFRSAGSADGAARGIATPAAGDFNALIRQAAKRG